MVCFSCNRISRFAKGVFKMAPEKYEAPEVEFVEMEEDVVTASSNCTEYIYGDGCTGSLAH